MHNLVYFNTSNIFKKKSRSHPTSCFLFYFQSESKPQSTSSFYDSKPESVQSSPKQPSPSLLQSSFSLWVDKYKPKTTKQIVGQQGDKSVVNKLLKWLKNWQVWHHDLPGSKKPTKPSESCSLCILL